MRFFEAVVGGGKPWLVALFAHRHTPEEGRLATTGENLVATAILRFGGGVTGRATLIFCTTALDLLEPLNFVAAEPKPVAAGGVSAAPATSVTTATPNVLSKPTTT